ncbi:hypothetical protein LB572_33800 [Mesorhizobium sp. BH1-1-5]|uniref:hypothetical protein n=1 Tax=Mesorhizobium sp. BH1-1-5 TaxID=2876661 RepID=UPI001CD0182F|nr:hypothetical protein [Mesorhizobium sp. BH1-1-5]MBZ9992076.1 hypothetical protein [Mesorhizobium sp. BH1-1-5]
MLIATAGTLKDCPICGSEVEMIVESSNCMKKATATINATRRACRAELAGWDTAALSGMLVMTRWLKSISMAQSRAYPTNFRVTVSPVMDEPGVAEENA